MASSEQIAAQPPLEAVSLHAERGRVAVIDIGSNSVRLVVYDTPTELPVPVFNEKVECALGRGLGQTGRLNPDGVEKARACLTRFSRLTGAMGVERVDLLATAAVRRAEDGPAFVTGIEAVFGQAVQVLSGEQEAQLAALGLLSGVPDADGLLGDLGGGSLDLVMLNRGTFGDYATLPLGHLALPEAAGYKRSKAAGIIADQFADIVWLPGVRGRTLYIVGGAWRALARLFIDQTGYPLHVIDNYALAHVEALRMADLVAGLSTSTLEKIPGISRKRAEAIPYAALVLKALIETAKPRHVCFSAFSMREGQLVKGLPEGAGERDPLIAGCRRLAAQADRFAISGDEILHWMDPLFPDETAPCRRIRLATCLISDMGWTEHPDYRAEHAFHRALRLPFAGLTHAERVVVAVSVYVRYNGDPDSAVVRPVHNLLNSDQRHRAVVTGLALRLAHTLAGSAPGVLSHTTVRLDKKDLTLDLSKDAFLFAGDAVERRFKTLARRLGVKSRIVTDKKF